MSARWKNISPAVVILGAAFSFPGIFTPANGQGCAGGGSPQAPRTVPVPMTQPSAAEREREQRQREQDAQIENIDKFGKEGRLLHYLENPDRCRRLIHLLYVRTDAWDKIRSYAQDPNNRSAIARITALAEFEDKYQWLLFNKSRNSTWLLAADREQMKDRFQKIRAGDRDLIDPDARAEMAR